MNSIPLIKGNTPQEINTSIISLKKALAALEAQDKQLQGNGNDVQNKIKQINELINGINLHLETIDGQITTAIENITEIASSLPTDAVLHYSFDEVPDYPDGTAELLQTQFDSTSGWNAPSDITVSVENNSLKLVSTGSRQYVLAINGAFSASRLKGKIVKVKVHSASTIARCGMQEQNPSSYPLHLLSLVSQNGNEYVFCGIMPSDMSYSSYLTIAGTTTAFIKEIYVGNGSYATPVIDNANGQNNGTNNGGFAVKGVSGKGAYFLNGKYARNSKYTLTPNFSLSIWVKPDNNTLSLLGTILRLGSSLYLVNGSNAGGQYNTLYITLRYADSTYQTIFFDQLLAVNWTNIVITKIDNTLKVYINGNLTENISLTQELANAVGCYCCSADNTRPQSVDDLLIFDRALSEAEVTALYLNRANTPKYYSWADWKLNQMENANRSVIAETRSIEESGEEER